MDSANVRALLNVLADQVEWVKTTEQLRKSAAANADKTKRALVKAMRKRGITKATGSGLTVTIEPQNGET